MTILISVSTYIIGVHVFSNDKVKAATFFFDDWKDLMKSFDMDPIGASIKVMTFDSWMREVAL